MNMSVTKDELRKIIETQHAIISKLGHALEDADKLQYKNRNPSTWTTDEDIIYQAMYLHSKWRYEGLV
jgi:hypothetical protein